MASASRLEPGGNIQPCGQELFQSAEYAIEPSPSSVPTSLYAAGKLPSKLAERLPNRPLGYRRRAISPHIIRLDPHPKFWNNLLTD